MPANNGPAKGVIDKYSSFRQPQIEKGRFFWCNRCAGATATKARRSSTDISVMATPLKRLTKFAGQIVLVLASCYLSFFSILRVLREGNKLSSEELVGGVVIFVMSSLLSIGFIAVFIGLDDPSAPQKLPEKPKKAKTRSKLEVGGRTKKRVRQRLLMKKLEAQNKIRNKEVKKITKSAILCLFK